jgi:predicted GIY-YIG superfamily endonuclease
MNDFYVYILKCNDDSYYVGHTDDIGKRISQHNSKEHNSYTSKRLPVEVVFVRTFETRDEAFWVERQIKKWSRQKKEALIEGNFSKVSSLSKKHFGKENYVE